MPLTAVCLILTLALGVAATSVASSILNAFFIRPLPVREPDRLVRVYRHAAGEALHLPLRYPEFQDLVRLDGAFDGGTAEEPLPVILGAAGSYERVWADVVSAGYFATLGISAREGRLFGPTEDASGEPALVLGERFWRRRFAADPNVVGQTVQVDGRPYRIVGVAPAAFGGTVPGFAADLWLPIRSLGAREREPGHSYFVLARLAPNADLVTARVALEALALRLETEQPTSNRGVRFAVTPEAGGRVPPPFGSGFLAFSLLGVGAGLLVALTASVNAAGVLLAGAAARQREIAVRTALGASRRRVVMQVLAEAAALAVPAGAAGVAIAWVAARMMSAIEVPIARGAALSFDFGLDARALAAGVAVTMGTVLIVGLAPALEGSRTDVVSALTGVPSARRSVRTRTRFLTGQVAVSMVLVAGCGLFTRSLQHAAGIDVGFDPTGVVAASVDRRASPETTDAVFWPRLLREVRVIPGVEAASLTTRLPLELGIVLTALAPDGFTPTEKAGWPSVEFAMVNDGYFETMRIPFLEGRDFTPRDADGREAVAIVNEVLARRFWPEGTATGRHAVSPDGGRVRIVGVVRASKYLSIGEDPKPYVYFRFPPASTRAATIVARGRGDTALLLRSIGAAARRLDIQAPLYDLTTMSARVATSLAPARAGATGLGFLAAIAVALTAVGLFGAVAQSVTRRTYEIGVRRALGAPDGRVVWLIMRDTLAPVTLGTGMGLAIALATQPVLRAVLYDVSAVDPLVVGIAPAVTLLLCALAAWVPSRRATRISAAGALRAE
jgi:predicted permease